MDDVRGVFLGMPHGTTQAAVTTNKNIIMNSFKISRDLHPPFPRRLHMKFGILTGQVVSEETMFENNGYVHVYSPGAGADNPLVSFFSLTVLFSQYSPLLQVFLH